MKTTKYKQLILDAGYNPTAELLAAVEAAHEKSASFELVDTVFKQLVPRLQTAQTTEMPVMPKGKSAKA